jgi:hypothetical protein
MSHKHDGLRKPLLIDFDIAIIVPKAGGLILDNSWEKHKKKSIELELKTASSELSRHSSYYRIQQAVTSKNGKMGASAHCPRERGLQAASTCEHQAGDDS